MVIAVLCVTAVIVLFARRPRIREHGSGRYNFCSGRIKAIGMGCEVYALDYEGMFPDQLSSLYPLYISELRVFVCPNSTDKLSSPDRIAEDGSYVYVTGLTSSHPADTVLAYDKPGNHGTEGREQLYVDGHVEWVRREDWVEPK